MSLSFKRLLFKALLFTAVLVSSSLTLAQQNKNKYSLTVDGAALAQQGIGLKVDYAFTDNIMTGIFGKQYKSDSEGFIIRSKDPNKYEFAEVGMSITYYFTSVFTSGLYTSFGYAAGVNNITYNDPVYGVSSDEDSDTGVQFKVGYQFTGELNKNHTSLFQFGFGYGAAGEGQWANEQALIQQVETQLDPGMLLDFNLGMTF